jgi:predicted ATPase/DNA-binding XRE family transcriptional regulator
MKDDQSFGMRVRQCRKALGWTQAKLAKELNFAVETIRKIEAGQRGTHRPPPELVKWLEDHTPSPPHPCPRPPTWRTPFIGREKDIEAVQKNLMDRLVCLLTLTGPPGVGKTRLAVEVASKLQDQFKDGFCFVDLAPIGEPALVVSTIAKAVGVKEVSGEPLLESLGYALRDKQLLLVLDNFEHLVKETPQGKAVAQVASLLEAAPALKMLVTSRTALSVFGQQEFPVQPLSVPKFKRLPPTKALMRCPAVELFVARARAVNPQFKLTYANAREVVEICARLDGVPLAIELAAVHSRALAPKEILGQLENRLGLMVSGDRPQNEPLRHQTIQDMIDWSYQLLEVQSGEQALFERLAVFVGGCALRETEAVCTRPGNLSVAVVDGLESLVKKSLLQRVETAEGETRFTMLGIIREYALGRLVKRREHKAIKQQHAHVFLQVAEEAMSKLQGLEALSGLNRLEIEHDNLRAALDWAHTTKEIETEIRLVLALGPFWEIVGYWNEGRKWLDAVLNQIKGAVTAERVTALYELGGRLARHQGDLLNEGLALSYKLMDLSGRAAILHELGWIEHAQANHKKTIELWEKSLALYRDIEDKAGTAKVLLDLGWIAYHQGKHGQVAQFYEESLTLYTELGHARGRARVLNAQGELARFQANFKQALTLFKEAEKLFRKIGDKGGIVGLLTNRAELERSRRNYKQAIPLYRECMDLCWSLGYKTRLATTKNDLGETFRQQKDMKEAERLFNESIEMLREIGNEDNLIWPLRGLGEVMLWQRNYGEASNLFKESLSFAYKRDNRLFIGLCLRGLAATAALGQKQSERAACLLGAAQALSETTGSLIAVDDQTEFNSWRRKVRAQLTRAAFETAWAEGYAMARDQVVEYALKPEQTIRKHVKKSARKKVKGAR